MRNDFIKNKLAILGLFFLSNYTNADLFMYTQQTVASGTIGGTTFTDATLIFTSIANTNDVFLANGNRWDVLNQSLKVDISGIGIANFTEATYTFCLPAANAAGFYAFDGTADIIDTINSSFSTYDLKTEIGPITGTPLRVDRAFATDMGSFHIDSFSGNVTFQATAVPEPASIVLISSAIGGIVIFRRKIKRNS